MENTVDKIVAHNTIDNLSTTKPQQQTKNITGNPINSIENATVNNTTVNTIEQIPLETPNRELEKIYLLEQIAQQKQQKQHTLEKQIHTKFKNYCSWCGTLLIYNSTATFIRCSVCEQILAVDCSSHVPFSTSNEPIDQVSQCIQWTETQVGVFLRSLECDNHTIQCLSIHHIDGYQLLNLCASDLYQIGVKNEEQVQKLLVSIRVIKESALVESLASDSSAPDSIKQLVPPVNSIAPRPRDLTALHNHPSLRSASCNR